MLQWRGESGENKNELFFLNKFKMDKEVKRFANRNLRFCIGAKLQHLVRQEKVELLMNIQHLPHKMSSDMNAQLKPK